MVREHTLLTKNNYTNIFPDAIHSTGSNLAMEFDQDSVDIVYFFPLSST